MNPRDGSCSRSACPLSFTDIDYIEFRCIKHGITSVIIEV